MFEQPGPGFELLTLLAGLQFEEEGGSGTIGAPSLNKPHVSLGTLGKCWAMMSAVSIALIKVEQTNLVYLMLRHWSLWPVWFACILEINKTE